MTTFYIILFLSILITFRKPLFKLAKKRKKVVKTIKKRTKKPYTKRPIKNLPYKPATKEDVLFIVNSKTLSELTSTGVADGWGFLPAKKLDEYTNLTTKERQKLIKKYLNNPDKYPNAQIEKTTWRTITFSYDTQVYAIRAIDLFSQLNKYKSFAWDFKIYPSEYKLKGIDNPTLFLEAKITAKK